MASMPGHYRELVEVDVPVGPRDRTQSLHRGLEAGERLNDLGWQDVAEARSRGSWRLRLPEGWSPQPDGDSNGRIPPHVHPTDGQARLDRPLVQEPRDAPLIRRIENARARAVLSEIQQDVHCLRGALGCQRPDAHPIPKGARVARQVRPKGGVTDRATLWAKLDGTVDRTGESGRSLLGH